MDIASLGISIDTSDVAKASTDLDKLTKAGGQAEQSATGLMNEMQALERSLASGARSTLELTKQRDSLAKLTKVGAYSEAEFTKISAQLDRQQQSLAKSTEAQAGSLDKLLNKLDPARAALAGYNKDLATLGAGYKAGNLDLDQYTAKVGEVNAKIRALDGGGSFFDQLSLGTKSARENFLQLGNAIAEGNLRVAAHNLLEIGANAGGSALRLAALAGPFALVAAGAAALFVAYEKGADESDEFNKQLILTGNYAGTSVGQLSELSRQVAATVGTTGSAAAVLAQLAGTGKIASGSFQEIAEAAQQMEKATGQSVDSTIAEFVKIADDPVAAAKSLNEQYHFLTASVYSQIVALKEQGDTIGATKVLTDTYADTIKNRSAQIINNLSLWERAWKGIRSEAAKSLDALNNVGRTDSAEKQIDDLTQKIAYLQSTLGAGYEDGDARQRIADLQLQLSFQKQQLETRNALAAAAGLEAQVQEQGIAASARLKAQNDANLTPLEKRNKLQKEYLQDVEKARRADPNDPSVTPAAVAKGLANIAEKNKDPKGPANQLDLTGFNDAQNNLKSITGYYQNLEKELESAQKAGLVSAESYSSQRVAIVEQEKGDVTAAYEAEIAALQAVRDKSSTTGQQRIQLDQKIADARASMVKAQADADTQLEVLANNEKGRIDKQTRSIDMYVQALGQQQKALELAGQRAVLGVGRGDRQNALNGELNSQQDRFAQQSLDLENQRSDPSRNMSDEEFAQKSQALADANKKATDQIRQNYADVQAAQGDWTKGASAAWENYLDSARDVAGQTKSLFANAFSSMEDAIVNFAMTGKLSFSDFAKSVIADMARIALRQAESQALSSLFGGLFSAGAQNVGSAAAASGYSTTGYAGAYGFDAGGYTGDGGKYEPAGIVHKGEYVLRKEVVQQPGMREYLSSLNKRGYADGGYVGLPGGSGGGGGSSIQISAPVSIAVPDRSSEGMELDQAALQQNLQAQIKQAAEKAVADSWRPGGVSFRQSRA